MNGCVKKDTIRVDYKLRPRFSLGEDQLICNGQPITLKPLVEPLWDLLWNDGSNSKTYSVIVPGVYSLKATNECGNNVDEIEIKPGICKIYIPSIFTPNDDYTNDELRIMGTETVTEFSFKVFNRYGQIVFETKDKEKGWNGKTKSLEQPSGTYVWILNYKDINHKSIQYLKGTVLVIR
jgi:gliding motility-associated-like protein